MSQGVLNKNTLDFLHWWCAKNESKYCWLRISALVSNHLYHLIWYFDTRKIKFKDILFFIFKLSIIWHILRINLIDKPYGAFVMWASTLLKIDRIWGDFDTKKDIFICHKKSLVWTFYIMPSYEIRKNINDIRLILSYETQPPWMDIFSYDQVLSDTLYRY